MGKESREHIAWELGDGYFRINVAYFLKKMSS